MLLVAAIAVVFFTSTPPGALLATTVWGQSTEWALTALPLFVWMGEILVRTKLADDMFNGLAPWVARVPGRLVHVNVLGCGLFAAVSGSSTATTATIGRINLTELRKRGYQDSIVLGSLAGSGTLGILIPPSIIMIVYGVAADVPITHLFIAGVLPGIMLMALFSGYIAVHALLNPTLYPAPDRRLSLVEKISASRRLIPTLALIVAVIGSIYLGIATATEAAGVGVVGALVIAAASRTLTWESFKLSVMTATRTNCMIFFILAGSAFLSGAMGFTGIPRLLATYAGDSQISPANLIIVLTLLMIVLGCFIDGISLVVLTTSVLMPMVVAAKIDPLWFGIYLVVVVEMGLVTPPVGFNLFVIQALTNRNLFYIGKVATPFFLLMVVAVLILWWYPEIATWLPAKLTAR